MRRRTLVAASASVAAALPLLAGCVANAPADGGNTIAVESTETDCTVSATTGQSGTLVFDVKNSGERITEFYLLADDQLRIIGEVENIAPGTSRQLTVAAQPGTYYTACKPGMIGAGIGTAEFTVEGEVQQVSADDQAVIDQAAANYVGYIKSQVSELLPAVEEFAEAYASGDDEKARELFPQVRVFYERIEPTAEAFGDLDPKIDYREVDAVAEGLDWTGFHRIEKDLWEPAKDARNSNGENAWIDWEPSTDEQRQEFADLLIADVTELNDLVTAADFAVGLADISNGAIGLMDEVATGKISGEEDWWSHTDLWDFKANVEGAEVAYGYVRDIATSKGEEGAALVEQLDTEFDAINALLAEYGDLENGFVSYTDLSEAQVKELSDQVNALAEPLSQLTQTVLG